MDVVLSLCDSFLLNEVYPASLPADNLARQFMTLFGVVCFGGMLMYLSIASLNYLLVFDHNLMKHKRFLKNQVRREISYALENIPWMALPTVFLFLLQVHGYSRLYDNIDEYGWAYWAFSVALFLLFLDMSIYWIHRWLHIPALYKRFHKPHHKWIVPSPFASHAFHWVDGFSQSLPYHVFVFLFPLHKWTYLGLFVFVNIWTVSIHDGDNRVPVCLQDYFNGSAHHTDHHMYFDCNFGQFFTLWDRIGGSHRNPQPEKFDIMSKDLDPSCAQNPSTKDD